MANQIEFFSSDWPAPHLEPLAIEIAEFLHVHKSKIDEFNSFMRISGNWKMATYQQSLERWIAGIMPRPKRAAADTKEMINLIRQIFQVCLNDSDWKKIRGLIAEKIFEIYFNKKHSIDVEKGYGALVKINQTEIKYRPSNPFDNIHDSDLPRQTVDAGSWDGVHGEFVEVKFNPEAFHTKDINYLKLLQSELDKTVISHQIFLVSFDDTSLIKRKLQQIGLLSGIENFKLLNQTEVLLS